MAQSAKVVDLPVLRRRRNHELAFLPAALEIMETPVSPAGRAVMWSLIALFCGGLGAAWFGQIDIIATAAGKIIPTSRSKIIQPLESGVVRTIRVEDGQSVRAGDVLIELDPTMSGAERDRQASELMSVQLDIARLRVLVEGAEPATFTPPDGASFAQVATQKQLLLQQLSEHRAKLAALDGQQAQRRAERMTVEAELGKLGAALPLLRQRAEIRRYLADKEIGSKVNYLEIQQTLVEYEHQVKVQEAKLVETEAAMAANAEVRRQTVAEFRRMMLADLASAEQKAAALAQELVKAEQRARLQQLTAPVDGTVQQLQVTTVGGVVTPAQQLMVVVPADSWLEVQAVVQNKDIGFVREGQDVEIKIDTFNFTKYGLLHGTVVNVSHDALSLDRSSDKLANLIGPPNQETFYTARISLNATQMQVDDRTVNLGPGMAVTAEIRTGRRRLIEYLISPLLRYRQDALRER